MITRRETLLVAVGAGLASFFGVGLAAAADESAVKAFLGSWKHIGGDAELKARDRAIDDVVSGMNGLIRGIARGRLAEANAIASSLVFSADKKSLTVAADGRKYTAPFDGTKKKVKVITGDEMKLHYAFPEKAISQVFEGDDKGRTNHFKHSGKKLVMNVTVTATQLPKKLAYKLTYEPA